MVKRPEARYVLAGLLLLGLALPTASAAEDYEVSSIEPQTTPVTGKQVTFEIGVKTPVAKR